MRAKRLAVEAELMPFFAGFPPGNHWLLLAPHPDDEVLGPGATLALARERDIEVTVVIVTDGGGQGDPVKREQEAQSAAQALGLAPPRFWRLADRSLKPDDRRLRGAIAETVRELAPDVLFVTSPVELHPDHRALALAVQRFLRRSTLVGLRRRPPAWVAAYEVATPVLPNLLVVADAAWERKRRAVVSYASQLAVRAYDASMEAMGTLRSLTLDRVRHAEALHVLPAGTVARLTATRWAALMGSTRGVRSAASG